MVGACASTSPSSPNHRLRALEAVDGRRSDQRETAESTRSRSAHREGRGRFRWSGASRPHRADAAADDGEEDQRDDEGEPVCDRSPTARPPAWPRHRDAPLPRRPAHGADGGGRSPRPGAVGSSSAATTAIRPDPGHQRRRPRPWASAAAPSPPRRRGPSRPDGAAAASRDHRPHPERRAPTAAARPPWRLPAARSRRCPATTALRRRACRWTTRVTAPPPRRAVDVAGVERVGRSPRPVPGAAQAHVVGCDARHVGLAEDRHLPLAPPPPEVIGRGAIQRPPRVRCSSPFGRRPPQCSEVREEERRRAPGRRRVRARSAPR